MRSRGFRWFVSLGYLALLAAAAVAALFALFTRGPGGWWEIAWLVITPMMFPCAACILVPSVGKGRIDTFVKLASIAVGVLVLGGLLLVGLGFGDWLTSERWRADVSTSTWALAMLAGLWAILGALPPGLRWIRIVAAVLGAVAACGWVIEVAGVYSGTLQGFILAPTLIVIALVLALPALLWLGGARAAERRPLQRAVVAIGCPRCGRTQRIACPGAACVECGLSIRVELDEPRCDCGYLLFGLNSDRCPECGRDVRGRAWPAPPVLSEA
jgi:hypothetical protein